MLSFSLVAEALIYHHPSGENSSFQFTPCLMMGEVSLEMLPKNIMIQDMINSENSMNTTESTNTNIFKNIIQTLLPKKIKILQKFYQNSDAKTGRYLQRLGNFKLCSIKLDCFELNASRKSIICCTMEEQESVLLSGVICTFLNVDKISMLIGYVLQAQI